MEEYWEENFWVTTSGVQDDGTLMDTLRSVGEDRVMFSADYPYEDDLEMAAWFDRVELNGRTKRKIAFQNARELLKLGNQLKGN
jgi:gamma-resorcylate decarboxylase